MAATTIVDAGPNVTKQVTMDATPGNAREIKIPKRYARITLYFTTSADAAEEGKFAHTGTDAAAIGSDVLIIPSGAMYPVSQSGGRRVETATWSVFVAGASASGYCYVHCEEQNDG